MYKEINWNIKLFFCNFASGGNIAMRNWKKLNTIVGIQEKLCNNEHNVK